MRCTLRNIALASLVASFSGFWAGPAFARDRDDEHHREEGHDRFADRRDLRQDYRNLESWRNKLRYDESHHASRKKLAEDENATRRLETDIRNDRQ
jgi:hypothetical protein